MTNTETITLAPTRATQRLQGTPEHPSIEAGTALWVGTGSTYANPFEVYAHCNRPKGDWGVRDTGRFHDSIWSAAMFSDCPQPECDDFYAANVSGP